jgi:sugar O-acyltransferase (sialic acid O-acetyltransferase NeuD family)
MRLRKVDVVLLGAGGLAREAVEATRARPSRATVTAFGYLDDDLAKHGQVIGGLPVLGPTTAVGGLAPDLRFVAAVASSADPGRRSRLVERLDLPDSRYGRIIHPNAALAPSTVVGVGAIVLAGVVATCDVTIGRHVAVMPGCVLTHDVVLGDGCTLASGVQLAGGVQVGADAYLGSAVSVREGVEIGAGAVIGMGAVVLNDVPPGEVWVGVPARPLR